MRRGSIVSTASVVVMSAVLVIGCGDGDDPVTGSAGQNATVATTAAGAAASTTTSMPATTAADVDEIDAILPFVDAFDDDSNGWGGPFQRFDDGDYVWELPAGQSDRRSPDTLIAVEDDIEAVDVTASLSVEGLGAVGVECAFEELEGSARWYRLLLGEDGAEITEQGLGMVAATTLASSPSVRLIDGESNCVWSAGPTRTATGSSCTSTVSSWSRRPMPTFPSGGQALRTCTSRLHPRAPTPPTQPFPRHQHRRARHDRVDIASPGQGDRADDVSRVLSSAW
jgi:hypothetical protein